MCEDFLNDLVLVAGVLVGAATCLSGSAPVGLRRTSLQ
jgi:hypothetical protein